MIAGWIARQPTTCQRAFRMLDGDNELQRSRQTVGLFLIGLQPDFITDGSRWNKPNKSLWRKRLPRLLSQRIGLVLSLTRLTPIRKSWGSRSRLCWFGPHLWRRSVFPLYAQRTVADAAQPDKPVRRIKHEAGIASADWPLSSVIARKRSDWNVPESVERFATISENPVV